MYELFSNQFACYVLVMPVLEGADQSVTATSSALRCERRQGGIAVLILDSQCCLIDVVAAAN